MLSQASELPNLIASPLRDVGAPAIFRRAEPCDGARAGEAVSLGLKLGVPEVLTACDGWGSVFVDSLMSS